MKKTRLSQKDKQAIIIICCTVAVVVVIGLLAAKLKSSTVKLDQNTLCPTHENVANSTIILIDKSDKWEINDVQIVEQFIIGLYEKIPVAHRLKIVAIAGEGRKTTSVQTVFDMCNPGNEEECNALYQNCRRIRRKYEESFQKPLENIVDFLASPGESSYSPLLETIIEIIDANKDTNLDIYIISDLMENGRKFRFYEVIPLAEEIVTEYPIVTQNQITAHLLMIERRRHSRPLINAVKNVWGNYFSEQNIKSECQRLMITE